MDFSMSEKQVVTGRKVWKPHSAPLCGQPEKGWGTPAQKPNPQFVRRWLTACMRIRSFVGLSAIEPAQNRERGKARHAMCHLRQQRLDVPCKPAADRTLLGCNLLEILHWTVFYSFSQLFDDA
jgi:hypothetical protein